MVAAKVRSVGQSGLEGLQENWELVPGVGDVFLDSGSETPLAYTWAEVMWVHFVDEA